MRPLLAVLALLLLTACGTPDHQTVVTTDTTTTTVDDTAGEASRVHLAALVTWAHATATTTTTVVRVAPQPTEQNNPGGLRVPESTWQRLADCESGDWIRHRDGSVSFVPGSARWHVVGAHQGGLQFLASTWAQAGGTRYAPGAHQATREQQIRIADAWLARTSWAQWPTCSRRLGLR